MRKKQVYGEAKEGKIIGGGKIVSWGVHKTPALHTSPLFSRDTEYSEFY